VPSRGVARATRDARGRARARDAPRRIEADRAVALFARARETRDARRSDAATVDRTTRRRRDP